MLKRIAAFLALAFALGATSAFACPGDKGKTDGKGDVSKPAQPKPGT